MLLTRTRAVKTDPKQHMVLPFLQMEGQYDFEIEVVIAVQATTKPVLRECLRRLLWIFGNSLLDKVYLIKQKLYFF